MENEIRSVPYESSYLMHYGIKGQKWGVRRYQNTDGSWTAAGRARYSKSGGRASNVSYGGAKTKALRKFAGNVGNDVGKAVRKAGRKTRAYAEAIDEVWGVRKGLNKAFENGVAGAYKAGRKIGDAASSGSRKLAKKGRKVYNNALDKLVSREMRKNAKAYEVNPFDMENEGERLLRLVGMKKNNPIKRRAALKAYNDNYRSLRRSVDKMNHTGWTSKRENPYRYGIESAHHQLKRAKNRRFIDNWQKQAKSTNKRMNAFNNNYNKAKVKRNNLDLRKEKAATTRRGDLEILDLDKLLAMDNTNRGHDMRMSKVPAYTPSRRKLQRGSKETVGLYSYKNKNKGKKSRWL